MLDEPANQLMGALEEALTAQIAVPAEEVLVFRHDLLRQAVMDGLPTPVRRWLHLKGLHRRRPARHHPCTAPKLATTG
jgi:hypothetical protein